VSPRPTAVVLRDLGLGDLLVAVPALRLLRRALPDHEIVLVAPEALAPLVARIEAVDTHVSDVHGYSRELHSRVDVAVNLHGRGPESHALLDATTVVPAVNQLEIHPYFQQREVQEFDRDHGILNQAWSPIGGITFYRDSGHASALEDPVIGSIAAAHRKSPAQVMLRWGLQQGRSVIPKSTRPARIAENLDVFDFDLTPAELATIDTLETSKRGGPEPEDITLTAFGRPIPEA